MSAGEELLVQAQTTRVAVVGGGIAGLVSALECARIGMPVTVFEAGERLGGLVRTAELDGVPVDAGADSFTPRSRALNALLAELELEPLRIPVAQTSRWTHLRTPLPLPESPVAGIPAVPFADDVRAIIGWGGAWRAYLDRLRPPLTIGAEHSLGALVRTRMGEKVLRRLVAPRTRGVYHLEPDDVDVDVLAPGLNPALTRTGSLSGAVATLDPAPPVLALDGGMSRLVDALAARIRLLGGDIRLGSPVQGIRREGEGWRIALAEGDEDPFALVVVAANETAARALLLPLAPGIAAQEPASHPVTVVSMLLAAPGLDGAPRGAGVLAQPGDGPVGVIDHQNARWGQELPAGRHVLRVQLDAPAEDGEAIALARLEGERLLGIALGEPIAARVDRMEQPGAVTRQGFAERAGALRRAVASLPGLGVVGGWIAGSGLARVAEHAVSQSEALRRSALFGSDDP